MAFLVFEGLDGSGKTSLLRLLGEELTRRRIPFIITREPGGTTLGDELRQVLLRRNGETPVPLCELLLYEAIRAQHVSRTIRPALDEKRWVLCDRFTASTLAFQAAGRNIRVSDAQWLNDFATGGLKPDLTVLLDAPVEVALARQQKRFQTSGQTADRFEAENKDFHSRVRQGYLDQVQSSQTHVQTNLQSSDWLVLDATQALPSVFEKLIETLKSRQWLAS